jgi:hypothetical protein
MDSSDGYAISFTGNPLGDFGVFAKGYAYAANSLAEKLLQAPQFADYQAYPVVFLYRHALELSLKHIIYSSVRIAAFRRIRDVEHRLHNDHDVQRLAQIAGHLLERLLPEDRGLHKAFSDAKRTAREFSQIDPRSYAYRYPVDISGKQSTERHQVVNLRAVAQTMSSILELLGTIHFGLSIELDDAQAVYDSVEDLLNSIIRDHQ